MNTILLTGVNGFLGNYLTPVLLSLGYRVIGMGKGACRLGISDSAFQYVEIDLQTEESIRNTLARISSFYILIHAAANSKPDDCEVNKGSAFSVNITATRMLQECACRYKAFFVYISTDFVFDGKIGMYAENAKPSPINYYGETKFLAEKIVLDYPYSKAIVRTVLVYGSPLTGRENILSLIYKKLKLRQPFKLVNDQYRTPTYVKDLAEAVAFIVDHRKEGIWHIAGEGLQTPFEMGMQLAEIGGLDKTLLTPVTQDSFKEIALRPRITGLNIDKARKELDFRPTPFEKAVREIFFT